METELIKIIIGIVAAILISILGLIIAILIIIKDTCEDNTSICIKLDKQHLNLIYGQEKIIEEIKTINRNLINNSENIILLKKILLILKEREVQKNNLTTEETKSSIKNLEIWQRGFSDLKQKIINLEKENNKLKNENENLKVKKIKN